MFCNVDDWNGADSMKKILATVISCVLLASCGAMELSKTYDGENFTFAYPDGWKVVTSDAGVDLINEEYKANVSVRFVTDPNSKLNQTPSISGLLTTVTQTLKGKIVSQSELTAGKYTGVWIETENETSVNFMLPCDGIIYQISLNPGQYISNVVSQIKEIAQTFVPKVLSVTKTTETQSTPDDPKTPPADSNTSKPSDTTEPPNNNIDDEKLEGERKESDNYVYYLPKGWKIDGTTLSEISTYILPQDSSITDVSININFQKSNFGEIDSVAKDLVGALGNSQTKIESFKLGDAQARQFEVKDETHTEIHTLVLLNDKYANIVYTQVKNDKKADYKRLVKSFRFK
jgi:hypothetical protein